MQALESLTLWGQSTCLVCVRALKAGGTETDPTVKSLLSKATIFLWKPAIDRSGMLNTHGDILLTGFSPPELTLNVSHVLQEKKMWSQITKHVWRGPVAMWFSFGGFQLK